MCHGRPIALLHEVKDLVRGLCPHAIVHQMVIHGIDLLYPLFSLVKKGILISRQSRSVRPSVCLSVTFHVNISPPKPLEVATSNFVGE